MFAYAIAVPAGAACIVCLQRFALLIMVYETSQLVSLLLLAKCGYDVESIGTGGWV